MSHLVNQDDTRTFVHPRTDEEVQNIIDNGARAEFCQNPDLDKNRNHCVTGETKEVLLRYDVAAGAMVVAKVFPAVSSEPDPLTGPVVVASEPNPIEDESIEEEPSDDDESKVGGDPASVDNKDEHLNTLFPTDPTPPIE